MRCLLFVVVTLFANSALGQTIEVNRQIYSENVNGNTIDVAAKWSGATGTHAVRCLYSDSTVTRREIHLSSLSSSASGAVIFQYTATDVNDSGRIEVELVRPDTTVIDSAGSYELEDLIEFDEMPWAYGNLFPYEAVAKQDQNDTDYDIVEFPVNFATGLDDGQYKLEFWYYNEEDTEWQKVPGLQSSLTGTHEMATAGWIYNAFCKLERFYDCMCQPPIDGHKIAIKLLQDGNEVWNDDCSTYSTVPYSDQQN